MFRKVGWKFVCYNGRKRVLGIREVGCEFRLYYLLVFFVLFLVWWFRVSVVLGFG